MPAIVELVELGVVVSRGPTPAEGSVPAASLPRLRVAGRLMRDLGVNVTGAALAVELLEARGAPRGARSRRLERLVSRVICSTTGERSHAASAPRRTHTPLSLPETPSPFRTLRTTDVNPDCSHCIFK